MKRIFSLSALAVLAAASTASAGPIGTGWDVSVYYNLPSSGPNTIAETQADIVGVTPVTDTPAVINYAGTGSGGGDGDIGGGVAPPGYGASNVDHYAIVADGWVTGLSGPTSVTLGVNSDDGFGFYDNGVQVFAADTNRGAADTTGTFTVNNGDHLQLVYWENGGGDEVEVWEQLQGGPFLVNGGSSTFGVNTSAPTPEPSTLVLAGLGCLGLLTLVRRRKAAVTA